MKRLPPAATIILAFALSACDNTEGPPASVGAPRPTAGTETPPTTAFQTVPDPAMAKPKAPERPSAPAPPPPPPPPDGFTVDLVGQRVFLPGEGWVSTGEFWDIYYTEPERLPAGIDHQALDAIRPAPD